MDLCPCCSGKTYAQCCKPLHEGLPAADALQLMRSRYAAYALNLPEYIIETTHPRNEQYEADKEAWRQQISAFSQNCNFEKLTILEFTEQGSIAHVTFEAVLSKDKQDLSFIEKSLFEKVRGRWLYRARIS